MQPLDLGPRPVGRAVVDEDQLERLAVEGRYGAPVELLERRLLVQERDDDREIGRIGHRRQGAYRRGLARRASRPSVARSGLPDHRGVAGADRALDAAWDSHPSAQGRERQADPDPDGAMDARAGRKLDPRRRDSYPPGSPAFDLRLLARGDVRALVRELRGAPPPNAGRLRHLRPQARPDRDARRDLPLEGRGRARAGSGARPARPRRGPRRGRPRARGVAVPDRLGGLAARSDLADPTAARGLGSRLG